MPEALMRGRIKKVFNSIDRDLDAVILKNSTQPHIDVNFFYVTRLSSGLFEGSTAILYPDLSLDVLTSQLEEESARKGREMMVSIFKTKAEQMEMIREKIGTSRAVGVNMEGLVSSDLETLRKNIPNAEFADVSEAFRKARVVKDTDEIELIRKASRIASEASEKVAQFIHRGSKEYEVAAELNYLMQKKGATSSAFDTIVAFGPNSAEAHHSSSRKRIKRGELALTDFGARYMLYCSDITRTSVFGKASRLQRDMFDTVLRAREAALEVLCEGVNGREVHRAAQDEIDSTKFKGKFTHGVGHSIGLSVHDGARIAATSDITLIEGMVFTIEPGIYIRGYGGMRVEDDILVTKRGYKPLSKASINLEI